VNVIVSRARLIGGLGRQLPVCQPIRGAKTLNAEKYLKNISLKGCQIISLTGVPTCLSSVLNVSPLTVHLTFKLNDEQGGAYVTSFTERQDII
jgi:hypothetical protein